jgi:hypothetical protein
MRSPLILLDVYMLYSVGFTQNPMLRAKTLLQGFLSPDFDDNV